MNRRCYLLLDCYEKANCVLQYQTIATECAGHYFFRVIKFLVLGKVTNADGTKQVLSCKIECHRLLLAAANPVFKDMFYGPSPVQGDTVVVEVMQIFL